jgi:hypothetical protein
MLWRPSVQQLRDAVLRFGVVGPSILSHGENIFGPTEREVETITALATEAVNAGRVIDFGLLPNAVIMDGGNRGGPLYNLGAMPMPFRGPWLLRHTWDSPGGETVAIYLVHPVTDSLTGEFEAVEIEPMINSDLGLRILTIGDRGVLLIDDGQPPTEKYHARVVPSIWRSMPGVADVVNRSKTPEDAAAGNLFDPIMCALMILSTKGIARETVRADAPLQKARMKSGKAPIPPHDVVHAAPYVSAILARGKPRGEDHGGTHASPRWHLRRGHVRNYRDGTRTVIFDTLVNVDEAQRAAFKAGKPFTGDRQHYQVKT